jgi:SSS family transporter
MENTLGAGVSLLDYVVIGAFFALIIGIGVFFGRKTKSTAQYFGAGKQIPWWLSGASFYMISFSVMAFVMHTELAYKYGIVSFMLSWMAVPAAICSGLLFARRWRRIVTTSPLEYIEERYGAGMRQALVWFGLPTRLLDNSLRLFAIGVVISAGLGFSFETAIVICVVIVIIFTFLGGLKATIIADFVQLILLLVVAVSLPFLAFKAAGGFQATLQALPPEFWKLSRPDTTPTAYTAFYLFSYCLLLFLNYSTSWALTQRYYSTKDDKGAVKIGLLVGVLYLIGTPLFYSAGLAAYQLFPGLENTAEAYPLLGRTLFPIGMLGMFIAVLFSATMSTLAGEFNAISAVVTNDFYKRFVAKNASEGHLLLVGRIGMLTAAAAILGLTLLWRSIQGAQDLFNLMATVFAIFLPPVALTMLLGMLTPRVSALGGKLGLGLGILFGVTAFVLGGYDYFADLNLRAVYVLVPLSCCGTLLVMAIGSIFKPDQGERREQVLRFFKKVKGETL